MENLINGIHLQFFAEDDVESYNDVDFGVAFADDREHGINHLPASGCQRFRPALCSRNTPNSRQP